MTTTTTLGVAPRAGDPTPGPSRRSGRWIDDWRPEDPEFWNAAIRADARLLAELAEGTPGRAEDDRVAARALEEMQPEAG